MADEYLVLTAMLSRCARARSTWRQRPCRLFRVQLDCLEDDPHERRRLLDGLLAHGLIVLSLPLSAQLPKVVADCYREVDSFFRRPMEEKAPHAVSEECPHGCAIYEDGTEFFEVKRYFDERRWRWPTTPRGFRASVMAAHECMRDVATRALAAILRVLDMDVPHVLSMLDNAALIGGAHGVGLNSVSQTALRVWSYPAGGPTSPWHCDNSLVTLGAKGSARGLHVRLLDGRLLYPEDHLQDNDVVVYIGDALSYLSGGRVQPLMHEVRPPPSAGTSGDDGERRLSMPFFLRARRDVVLRPDLAAPSLSSAATLAPLRVAELEDDEEGVRQRWSWKQTGKHARYFAEPWA